MPTGKQTKNVSTESMRESQRRWRIKNADKQRALTKAWAEKNKDRINARVRERYALNPEKYRQKTRQKRDKDRAAYNKSERERRNNAKARAMRSAYESKRRAAKALSAIECAGVNEYFQKIKSSKSVNCYYCGSAVSGSVSHIDHMVPLARGGAHRVENLCVACPSCNLRKGKKTHIEFLNCGQMLLI
jgi:5-methylcytosine-specific restriction endonuclease McrA